MKINDTDLRGLMMITDQKQQKPRATRSSGGGGRFNSPYKTMSNELDGHRF